MERLFPASSEIRRVHREPAVLLGGQRALLMQVAHPAIAQAVAEHSDFPAHAVARLRRTVRAGFGIVFGTREQARIEAERINAIHERVHGKGYDALDPALLAWVHATLADTAMRCFQAFVGPVDRAGYWRDSRSVAALFRIPEDALPRSIDDFDRYVGRTVDALTVSETGRRLAGHIIRPPIRLIPAPAFAPLRAITASLLPQRLRQEFGLGTSRWEAAGVGAFAGAARAGARVIPAWARAVPSSRKG